MIGRMTTTETRLPAVYTTPMPDPAPAALILPAALSMALSIATLVATILGAVR